MNNQYFMNRLTGRDPNIRAADADRERTAERLRTGHTEGRLDLDEFQQRLDRSYAAKTLGELAELVKDLPSQSDQDERRSLGRVRPWSWPLIPLAPILIGLIVLSAAAGHHGHHLFWLWIPLVFLFWRMFAARRRRWYAGPRRGSDGWI